MNMISIGASLQIDAQGHQAQISDLSVGDVVFDVITQTGRAIHDIYVETLDLDQVLGETSLNSIYCRVGDWTQPGFFVMSHQTPGAVLCDIGGGGGLVTFDHPFAEQDLAFYTLHFSTSVLCRVGPVFLTFAPAHQERSKLYLPGWNENRTSLKRRVLQQNVQPIQLGIDRRRADARQAGPPPKFKESKVQ